MYYRKQRGRIRDVQAVSGNSKWFQVEPGGKETVEAAFRQQG